MSLIEIAAWAIVCGVSIVGLVAREKPSPQVLHGALLVIAIVMLALMFTHAFPR